MTRKTLALAAMVAGLLGILFTGLNGPGSGSATHLGLGAHASDPQVALYDNLVCRGSAGTELVDGLEDATTFPAIGPCSGEVLTTGTTVGQIQDTVIHKGNRLSLGVNWSSNAFGVANDAAIANGTLVGEVAAAINIACDDTIDFFLDSSAISPYNLSDPGETFQEQTTTYTATSGLGGTSEEFLNQILPPTSYYSKQVRYRADINFVTLGNATPVNLAVPVSLNAVILNGTFGDARASLTLLGGDPNAPSSQLVLCLDSPQTSTANISSAAGLSNPVADGLYAGWTTYLSAQGVIDEQEGSLGYITNCKQIGAGAADADNDCLADTADDDDVDRDQDNDGLLDGIDRTYLGTALCGASKPEQDPDCDDDGKTDAEEMLQTSAGLTNPRAADSDLDGVLDSGLSLDCNGDGAPDALDTETNAGGGRNRVMYKLAYCKPDGTNTATGAGLGGRPVGNPGAGSEDNCPGIANAGQENSSTVDPELNGIPGDGTNGRFGGTTPGIGDTTHAGAKFTGDACDGDDDNDGVADAVEGTMFYDSTGGAGSNYCNTDAAGVAAVTSQANRDSDGDSSLDGVECALKKNPADATSKPGTTMTPEESTFFRLSGLTQPGGSALGSIDDGSTIAGIPEVRGQGAGAGASQDTDSDGCPDETELTDVDGNRVAGDSDRLGIARAVLGVGTFAPPGSAQADLEERRAADLDKNGVLGDPDRLAAARIVLTAGLPAIPDYNLSCSAATIGYAAN